MHIDSSRQDLVLGIVGCGAMGRGIAQIAVQADIEVRLFDSREGAAIEAQGFVLAMLERGLEKGRVSAEQVKAARGRLQVVHEVEALADSDVVVEAIVERLEIKQDLFKMLETLVRDDAVLATNTSSLSITAIASACNRPERVIGFHFFNPVPLMRLVEVVPGACTEMAVVETMLGLARRMGHQPVRVSDSPGFLVNHAGRGFGTEAGRILSEGIAGVADIDRVMKEAAGFRLGPFELMDLVGLDVTHTVMESVYHQFQQEPRFRPPLVIRQLCESGLLGRKSGQGFYRYRDGQPWLPEELPPSSLDTIPAQPVWIAPAPHEDGEALRRVVQVAGLSLESGLRPSSDALCLVSPLGRDCTTEAIERGLNPAHTLAVDTLLGLKGRRTLMSNPATSHHYRELAHALLGADGIPVTLIHDSAGFIAQRVIAMIVNIACDIAQSRIAAPVDVDRAVELGLGYSQGPLVMGDRLGAAKVLQILENLQRCYGDPRYRPSPWLARRARLGLSLLKEDS